MGKGLTPIERAIAGEPADRRRRYEERMRSKGFVRVAAMVRAEDVALLTAVARKLREDPDATHELQALLAAGDGTERPQRSEDAPRLPSGPEARS